MHTTGNHLTSFVRILCLFLFHTLSHSNWEIQVESSKPLSTHNSVNLLVSRCIFFFLETTKTSSVLNSHPCEKLDFFFLITGMVSFTIFSNPLFQMSLHLIKSSSSIQTIASVVIHEMTCIHFLLLHLLHSGLRWLESIPALRGRGRGYTPPTSHVNNNSVTVFQNAQQIEDELRRRTGGG